MTTHFRVEDAVESCGIRAYPRDTPRELDSQGMQIVGNAPKLALPHLHRVNGEEI